MSTDDTKSYKNIDDIYKAIRHRPPFVMVDRVLSVVSGKSAECMKCISANEPYLSGHFPGYPVVPGVMMIESMAQVSGLIVRYATEPTEENAGATLMLVGVDKAKMRQQIRPGDIAIIRSELIQKKLTVYVFSATVSLRQPDNTEIRAMSSEIKLALASIF